MKTRATPKKRAKKKPVRPPTREQLLEHDPWHFDRENPIFAAVCKVYVDHPNLVYDHWEIWVGMHPTRPLDEHILEAGGYRKPVPFHDWLWPMGKLFPVGGGEIERQATSIIAEMHGIGYMQLIRLDGPHSGGARGKEGRYDALSAPVMKASEALVSIYRRRYDDVVDELANPRWGRRKPRKPRRSFDRIMRDCGFNQRLLGLLDREVERQQAKAVKAAAKPDQPQTPRRKKCTRSPSRSTARSKPSAGSARPAASVRSRKTAVCAPKRRVRASSSSAVSRVRAGGSSSPKRRVRSATTSRTTPATSSRRSKVRA